MTLQRRLRHRADGDDISGSDFELLCEAADKIDKLRAEAREARQQATVARNERTDWRIECKKLETQVDLLKGRVAALVADLEWIYTTGFGAVKDRASQALAQ